MNRLSIFVCFLASYLVFLSFPLSLSLSMFSRSFRFQFSVFVVYPLLSVSRLSPFFDSSLCKQNFSLSLRDPETYSRYQ